MNMARANPNALTWRIHTPNLLKEISVNPGVKAALSVPLNILGATLYELAELAIEIDDWRLHLVMFDLTLYDLADLNETDRETSAQVRLTIIENIHEQSQAKTQSAPEPSKIDLYDELANALMNTRPELEEMSLEEWLWVHNDKLSEAEKVIGSNIVDLHMEHGS